MRLPIKKKVPYLGLLLAIALILGYVESLIPNILPIPGFKLGLSNLAVVLCLFLFGWQDALILTIIKAVLSSLLFGNLSMMIYSLSGAIFSCLIMILFRKMKKIHAPGISALGGMSHNMAQVYVAYTIVHTAGVLYYLPVLMLVGVLTGTILGIICSLVIKPIKKVVYSRCI